MKHGYGIYNWADGSSYKGDWKDNIFHGKGEYHWKDDRKYIGNFENN